MRLACFVFAAVLMATNADVTDYNDDTFATAKVFTGGAISHKGLGFCRIWESA
jgi:hypothetical protein